MLHTATKAIRTPILRKRCSSAKVPKKSLTNSQRVSSSNCLFLMLKKPMLPWLSLPHWVTTSPSNTLFNGVKTHRNFHLPGKSSGMITIPLIMLKMGTKQFSKICATCTEGQTAATACPKAVEKKRYMKEKIKNHPIRQGAKL